MDYLSNDFVYKSQPEIITDNLNYNTDDDTKESNFLTDKQIEDLLEPFENNLKNKNKNILFLFLIFFLLIFCFSFF